MTTLQLLLKLVDLKFNIHYPNEGYFVFLFSYQIIKKMSEIYHLNAIQFNFHSF